MTARCNVLVDGGRWKFGEAKGATEWWDVEDSKDVCNWWTSVCCMVACPRSVAKDGDSPGVFLYALMAAGDVEDQKTGE